MATRGIFQLQKLTLYYCEYGGSSEIVRQFLSSGQIIDWAKERPSVELFIKVRNGKHPYVKADYLTNNNNNNNNNNSDDQFSNGNKKGGKKLTRNEQKGIIHHQICLKCNKSNIPNISNILTMLYNRSGRKIKKFTKPIYTQTPSIQGVWTPTLNLHLQPNFPMTIINNDDNDNNDHDQQQEEQSA